MVALGVAVLALGLASAAVPILSSATDQDSVVANAAIGPAARSWRTEELSGRHPRVDPVHTGADRTGTARADLDRAADPREVAPPRPAAFVRPTPNAVTAPEARATLPAEPAKTNKPKPNTSAEKAAKTKPAAAKKINIELTGYSWFDNTPAGSSEVSTPILHKRAGGQGTYADPITVAVADDSFKAGTRFYIPSVQRYVIVEDSGASDGDNHLDMWVGGQGGSESSVSKCMDRFTGKTTAEVNPPKGRPVLAGPIYSSSGCRLPKSSS